MSRSSRLGVRQHPFLTSKPTTRTISVLCSANNVPRNCQTRDVSLPAAATNPVTEHKAMPGLLDDRDGGIPHAWTRCAGNTGRAGLPGMAPLEAAGCSAAACRVRTRVPRPGNCTSVAAGGSVVQSRQASWLRRVTTWPMMNRLGGLMSWVLTSWGSCWRGAV